MASGSNKLTTLHRRLEACTTCPNMIGPVVHGPAVISPVYLLGQAPGPREGSIGKPFAWTAGKTLFRWFQEAAAIDEEAFRKAIYMAAVARCFPGKAKGGGDRKPDAREIAACEPWIREEVGILRPSLIIPVGGLAIERVLGRQAKLVDVVGRTFAVDFVGHQTEAICLPHPSGVSAWPKKDPGKSLLRDALSAITQHDAFRRALQDLNV